DEVKAALALDEVIEVNDIWVLELSQSACFLDEPSFDVIVNRKIGWQDLNGHLLLSHTMSRLVDDAHTALPEHFRKLVVAQNDFPDERPRSRARKCGAAAIASPCQVEVRLAALTAR